MSNKMNKKVSYIGKDEEILRAIARAQSEASKRSEDSKETAFDPPGSDHRTDSADRQAMEELKHRLRTTRRWGPDRPLAQLAHAEAELKTRSAALAKLSNAPRKQPDRRLLVHQLVRTVATSSVPTTLAPELRNDVIGLYSISPVSRRH